MSAATLSTHVLDVARGLPAAGVSVTLFALNAGGRTTIAQMVTNADGRTDRPLATDLLGGTYELVFSAGPYFASTGTPAFYDDVPVRFTLSAGSGGRYHVPLLLSPWGYSTYRGS